MSRCLTDQFFMGNKNARGLLEGDWNMALRKFPFKLKQLKKYFLESAFLEWRQGNNLLHCRILLVLPWNFLREGCVHPQGVPVLPMEIITGWVSPTTVPGLLLWALHGTTPWGTGWRPALLILKVWMIIQHGWGLGTFLWFSSFIFIVSFYFHLCNYLESTFILNSCPSSWTGLAL